MVDIFARGFADDPMFQFLNPQPDFARFVFEMTTSNYIDLACSCVDSHGGGATLWQGPGQQVKETIKFKAVWQGFRRFGLSTLIKLLRLDAVLAKHHPSQEHFYLFAIATAVEARGSGIGSALMRQTLRQADEAGIGCYLENSKTKNLPFYQGHGFKVVKQFEPLKGSPTMYLMWRAPVSR
jgi:ribosomal protein S18 acetylase RimI-like enzyme